MALSCEARSRVEAGSLRLLSIELDVRGVSLVAGRTGSRKQRT